MRNLREAGGEALDEFLKLGLEVLAEGTLLVDLVKDGLLVGAEVVKEVSLPLENLGDGDVVEVTVDTSVDEGNHLVDGHGAVLLLLEELGKTLTTGQGLLGGGIEIGTELGEGGDLTVLGQEELERTGDLLHGLELSGGTDTRDGKTDVNGGTDTLVEELSLQEDLTISDGNDVGGNVSGDITTLGLNDGQGSERTTTELVVHLGSTLEETRVEVENVTGVSLTTGRTTEKERHLTVSDGLLGKIVVDDDGVLAVVTEVLSHSAASERCKILEGSSLGGGGGNDDGVLHGIVLFKGLDELSDGGTLLTDGDVDAVKLLGLVAGVVPTLLVEHGIKSDGSLTSLTVTNDQLTLTTADGNHGIDGLETSLDGLGDGLTGKNTGSLELSTASLGGLDGALAIDGVTESVDDTAEKLHTDGNVDNLSGTLDGLTLLDETVRTEQDDTDLAGLEVHAHALDTGGELDELLSLDVGHTVNTSDTITDGKDTAGLGETRFLLDTTDSLLEDGRDLSGGGLVGVAAERVGDGSDSAGS
jgi:hypothetical protein